MSFIRFLLQPQISVEICSVSSLQELTLHMFIKEIYYFAILWMNVCINQGHEK